MSLHEHDEDAEPGFIGRMIERMMIPAETEEVSK
jgi:hypothetical protein